MINLTKSSLSKFVSVLLILFFSNVVFADEIRLYKTGTKLTLTEDLHCMNNATAKSVLLKVNLCEKVTDLKLSHSTKLHLIEMKALQARLDIELDAKDKIISIKDDTINVLKKDLIMQAAKTKYSPFEVALLSTVSALGAALVAGVVVYYVK